MAATRSRLFALPLLALLSGCLTIEEHYTFKKDGSGTMEYVVDMSELGAVMKDLEDLGDGNAKETTMDLTGETEALKAIPGISKVKLNTKKDWVQRIGFKFKDVVALNKALNQLMKDSTGVEKEFFRWEGPVLVRVNNDHARQLGQGMTVSDESGEESEGMDMGAMLGAMKYRYSFKFAHAVSDLKASERAITERPKPKQFSLETDFGAIAADPAALDLRITLDR